MGAEQGGRVSYLLPPSHMLPPFLSQFNNLFGFDWQSLKLNMNKHSISVFCKPAFCDGQAAELIMQNCFFVFLLLPHDQALWVLAEIYTSIDYKPWKTDDHSVWLWQVARSRKCTQTRPDLQFQNCIDDISTKCFKEYLTWALKIIVLIVKFCCLEYSVVFNSCKFWMALLPVFSKAHRVLLCILLHFTAQHLDNYPSNRRVATSICSSYTKISWKEKETQFGTNFVEHLLNKRFLNDKLDFKKITA